MCISNPITITWLFGSQTIASDGCARITGTTTAAYENDLYNVWYWWNGWFMQWYIPLMFDAWQNTIRSNTRMISNWSTVYIDYPANTVITTNWSAYTGVLILPIDLWTRFANTLNNIKSAIKFWSPTQSIVFSQPVNVNISLQNATPWGIVEIYTSNNGTDRTLHTTTIVQQNYLLNPVLPFVSFDTTHATYFAVVEKPWIALNSTNITQEPFNCPILATECYLQSKNIWSIATDTFINHPNLQQLYISNNLLSDISIWAFNGLNNLTWLFLYDNLLTTLPVWVFSSLNSLQELDIYQNQLTSLSVWVFSGLNSLGHLQLGWNKITTLPVWVFSGLNNLQQLYLYDNLLTTLPVWVFNGLNSLEGLYMGSNLLNLSIWVFNGLSSLRRLFIEDNKMTNIPVWVFSWLNSLQELYLSNNYFTSFPSWLFDGLIDLSILHIGSNPITNITQSLFDPLTSLYNLEMNDICIPDPITITLAFLSTTTNNNGCARITGTTAATYESNLYNRSYSLNGSFMEWWIPLSFNAWQNTIRSNTRMGFSSIWDLHVEYPANTVITTNWLAYTGILLPPRSLSTGFAKNISNVKSFIKFWSPTQSITFSQPVTVYMPTPNINIGENVEIYSSNNAENRTFHTTEIVGDFNGSPFVIFDTTHATYFAIGENGWWWWGQTWWWGWQSWSGLVFMTFDVEAGNISCIYGNFNLGTTGTSFASQVLTATSSSTRECIDMKWTNNNPIQLTMAVPITNGTTTIPASNTLIRTTNPSDICDSWVMVTPNFTPLSSSVDLMRKNDPLDICMYTSMPELQVTLPAKATQGTYNGSLTVTFPS
jgi:Leucine-rich repeat (LRR) protein